MIEKWHDQNGHIIVEIERHDDGLWYDGDKSFPGEIQSELNQTAGDAELTISFTSSGYNDPGRTFGNPEYCYPPESEDERLVTEVVASYIYSDGHPEVVVLSDNAAGLLGEWYEDQIQNEEIDIETDQQRYDAFREDYYDARRENYEE